jgi:adenylate kinase family enzyme
MVRGYVIGTSGSGKSTFAARLCSIAEIPHLELDSLRHQANWTPLPDDEMRRRVESFCAQSDWVIDGNYSFVRDIILDRVTDVFMLDYPKALVMSRIIRRTLSRMITRKELWNGNREDWKFLFKLDPEENVILWAWKTYDKRVADFDRLVTELPDTVTVHRFKTPAQAKRWLNNHS